MGLFSGIEFYDVEGNIILTAGRVNEKMPWFKYIDVYLEDNERIVGLKSGRRNEQVAHHYDL